MCPEINYYISYICCMNALVSVCICICSLFLFFFRTSYPTRLFAYGNQLMDCHCIGQLAWPTLLMGLKNGWRGWWSDGRMGSAGVVATWWVHYIDVMMVSQITSLTIVYSTVYWSADQRNHQSSMLLAFVRGIHRWSVNSLHKGPVTRKMFPFDDVIMTWSVFAKIFTLGNL